ncbi:MAG: TetR/AcrR family transcriptional regulator [Saprospiraceae bacterium]|jgi:TetR/AcrR family fatty acid metabolism transcriptional regulator|nr:TetR/AcrR family transcriptional regulator [Saprospiraceae bacterium]
MSISSISDRQFEIIQAAGKILSSSGVSGLTIKNLAKEMGFAESAIYRHFDSKETIVVAMLIYLADNMDERLGKVISNRNTPKENLDAIFNDQFVFFSGNPHFVVAVFSDGLMEASPKINAAILRIMQAKMKHLMPIIMEGQHQGYFTNAIPTEELMHIILGAFRLQMFKWRIANFQFDIFERGKYLMSNISTIIQPCKN